MLIVFPVHALSEELRFGYENYPPLTYEENGQPQGISIDLVREASRRLGFTPVFVNRPFARLLNEVQHGDIDCVMDVYKSPEREVYLYYPTSFVNPDYILLYVNSASGLDIRSFNDVGERKVGVVRGYFYGTGVLERLAPNLEYFSTCCTLYKMLAEGRINLALGNRRSVDFYLDRLHATAKVKPAFVVSQVFSHMAFSKKRGVRGQELADMYAREIEAIQQEQGRSGGCP